MEILKFLKMPIFFVIINKKFPMKEIWEQASLRTLLLLFVFHGKLFGEDLNHRYVNKEVWSMVNVK